jgi:hypothetical protein
MKLEGAEMDEPVDTGDKSGQPQVGESSDPEVQQLLARRQDAALTNQQDLIKGIDAELARKGYQR